MLFIVIYITMFDIMIGVAVSCYSCIVVNNNVAKTYGS